MRVERYDTVIFQLFVTCLGGLLCVEAEDYQDEPTTGNTSADGKMEDVKIDVRGEIRAQWKALAVVLNRILFLVFMIVAIIVTIALYAWKAILNLAIDQGRKKVPRLKHLTLNIQDEGASLFLDNQSNFWTIRVTYHNWDEWIRIHALGMNIHR